MLKAINKVVNKTITYINKKIKIISQIIKVYLIMIYKIMIYKIMI